MPTITGIILHIQHPSVPLVDLETVFGKLHGLGTDPVLKAAPPFGKRLHIKRETLGFICLEEITENLQALFCIQFFPNGGQLAQMGNDIRSHTGSVHKKNIDEARTYFARVGS